MFVNFGIGYIYLNPIAGNQAANPTPSQILGMQSASWEIDQKLVDLKGAMKGPDDVATADMTIKGKVEMGRIDLDLFNQVYFAEAVATDAPKVVPNEAHSVPGTSAFTITVTGSATFLKDLGVRYANGQPFTKVASVTVAGEYSVAAGVYTFFSADASAAVLISYTTSSTAGSILTVHNQLMGWGPVVEAYVWTPYASALNQSNNNGWHFYATRFSKAGFDEKRDNFTLPQLEFESYPNASGQWFDIFDGAGAGL